MTLPIQDWMRNELARRKDLVRRLWAGEGFLPTTLLDAAGGSPRLTRSISSGSDTERVVSVKKIEPADPVSEPTRSSKSVGEGGATGSAPPPSGPTPR